MKILHLCCWPPYPESSGGRQRTGAVLRHFRRRHQVQLVTFVSGPTERRLAEQDGAITLDYNYEGYDTSLPSSVNPFKSPQLDSVLQSLSTQGFDVTLFDHLYIAHCHSQSCGIPVLMEHNIESEVHAQVASRGPERMRGLAQALFLKRFEDQVWPAFPLRFCVSESDAQTMRERCPTGKVVVSENGVDLNRLNRLEFLPTRKIFFVGALDYFPNEDAVHFLLEEIMPLVWRREPDVVLRVAGRNPSQNLRERLAEFPRCELWSSPPDLTDLARTCMVSVVPLRLGGGTRLKILEAAAWGLPVVTTSKGCEGLKSGFRDHLCVADDAPGFADKICSLLFDPGKRQRMADEARAQVEEHYDWPRVVHPMEEAMEQLLGA